MSYNQTNNPGAGVVNFHQRDPEATIWIGGIDNQCTEDILYELFVQTGPIVTMVFPRDRVSGQHQGFAFIEYETPEDADYTISILAQVKLFGKSLRVNKALKEDKQTRDAQEWMVKLFIGGLAPEVDDKALSNIFNNFGALLSCTIVLDADTGKSKGYGFVTLDTFESGDAAILHLDGQYIAGKPVKVCYAFKKDSQTERHGCENERMLASKGRQNAITLPLTAIPEIPMVGTQSIHTTAPIGFSATMAYTQNTHQPPHSSTIPIGHSDHSQQNNFGHQYHKTSTHTILPPPPSMPPPIHKNLPPPIMNMPPPPIGMPPPLIGMPPPPVGMPPPPMMFNMPPPIFLPNQNKF